MHTCVICRFAAPSDDALAPTEAGRCLCLRCYHRAVGTERPMPAALRQQIDAVLATTPLV